ncbi:MAG TPA: hypothetical protein VGM94_00515 [Galbitalea sp.]|jgi:hypothetical protein
MTDSFAVASGGGRVVFQRVDSDDDDPRFGYSVEVKTKEDGAWKCVSATDNVLVAGPSFNLRPSSVVATDDGIELAGATESATWSGSVRDAGDGWIRFDVVLESEGFWIGENGAIEPQLTIDLGNLPPYERGDHVWFKTLVENPTRWNGEGRGNDFPALSYYDPYLKARFQVYYDMTPMSWMGADTIARFDAYHCGLRRLYRGRPAAEIGLVADAQSGNDFPAGTQRFRWYLRAEYLSDEPTPPTEADALRELVDACLPLLRPSGGYWPEGATSWDDYARGCAADLQNSAHSWASDDDGEFLLAYVDGRSDAWAVTMEARGRTHGGVGPCLEAAMWAVRPLDALLGGVAENEGLAAAYGIENTDYRELRDRLLRFVRAEVDRPRCAILGGRATKTFPIGTWQYVYMLSELWQLWRDRDDHELLARIRREVDDVAIPLAHNVGYLFPLQFDRSTLRKIGPGPAYAVAGTYALFMIDLAERYGSDEYLTEAKLALRALANVPIDEALQEVVLIAHALDAANRLATSAAVGDDEWTSLRSYFRAQTLRMMYWYDDETSDRSRMSSQLGMFLACANINYPAFFENIETDARLAAVLDGEDDPTELLRVLDYGRRNNFSFFPKASPDMFGPMPLDYIPFEEVPILEGPNNAGFLGQEIYGAGFTFRAHAMWDAFAVARNREVMVVSLRSYHEADLADASSRDFDFLVYNGSEATIDTEIDFPITGTSQPVTLGSGQWRRMSVTVGA